MSNTRPPLTAVSRRSYFQEAPMDEYTPASSVTEEPFRDRPRGSSMRGLIGGKVKVVLRVVHAGLHLGLCCVLLAIMVEFMLRDEEHQQRCVCRRKEASLRS